MLNRNSLAFGASIGALLPLAFYLLFQEVVLVERNGLQVPLFDQPTSLVLALAVNILPFSRLMKNERYEQTGKGILLSTFLYAAVFVFLKFFKEI